MKLRWQLSTFAVAKELEIIGIHTRRAIDEYSSFKEDFTCDVVIGGSEKNKNIVIEHYSTVLLWVAF